MRVLLLSFSLFSFSHSTKWTEQDDSRRIAQLMKEERLAFETEMRSQNQKNGRKSVDYDSYFDRSAEDSHNSAPRPGRITTLSSSSTLSTSSPSSPSSPTPDNWCYYCASPINLISAASRRTVMQFLQNRRTGWTYDKESTSMECIRPRDFTKMQKQPCSKSYCSTITFIDHEEGTSFVMRGCAENFGAVNEAELTKRGDNKCMPLHDKLDIRECICSKRKSCYTGKERSGGTSLTPFTAVACLLTRAALIR